jgi:hypothetical protein
MLEDLIDGVRVQLARLDGQPLAQQNSDPSPQDIISRILNLDFGDKR